MAARNNNGLQGKSYEFNSAIVHVYQGVNYLSRPKEGAGIVAVEDIGEVAKDDLPEVSRLSEAEVIVVITFNSYAACLGCKSKVEPMTGKLGQCCTCGMQQGMER